MKKWWSIAVIAGILSIMLLTSGCWIISSTPSTATQSEQLEILDRSIKGLDSGCPKCVKVEVTVKNTSITLVELVEVTVKFYDGEKNPFIFGEERTQILNRATFVLNLCTFPTDELSIRYYVAASNGAVVLTEPSQNRYPFVPGTHLVECSVAEMPDKVEHYLAHTNEWKSISESMLDLMKTDLTLDATVTEILAQAEQVLKHRAL